MRFCPSSPVLKTERTAKNSFSIRLAGHANAAKTELTNLCKRHPGGGRDPVTPLNRLDSGFHRNDDVAGMLMPTPLLTVKVHDAVRAAARAGSPTLACSLDLDRSTTVVEPRATEWIWQANRYPY